MLETIATRLREYGVRTRVVLGHGEVEMTVLGHPQQSLRELLPFSGARAHLSCAWIRRVSSAGPPYSHRVLANGCIELSAELGSGRLTVSGPRQRPRQESLAPGTTLVGVRFRLAAASALLGVSTSELVEENVELADVWGHAAHDLASKIHEAASAEGAARRSSTSRNASSTSAAAHTAAGEPNSTASTGAAAQRAPTRTANSSSQRSPLRSPAYGRMCSATPSTPAGCPRGWAAQVRPTICGSGTSRRSGSPRATMQTARTSGGYWYHQERIEPHPAVRDQRFQDQLLDALARFTGTRLG